MDAAAYSRPELGRGGFRPFLLPHKAENTPCVPDRVCRIQPALPADSSIPRLPNMAAGGTSEMGLFDDEWWNLLLFDSSGDAGVPSLNSNSSQRVRESTRSTSGSVVVEEPSPSSSSSAKRKRGRENPHTQPKEDSLGQRTHNAIRTQSHVVPADRNHVPVQPPSRQNVDSRSQDIESRRDSSSDRGNGRPSSASSHRRHGMHTDADTVPPEPRRHVAAIDAQAPLFGSADANDLTKIAKVRSEPQGSSRTLFRTSRVNRVSPPQLPPTLLPVAVSSRYRPPSTVISDRHPEDDEEIVL